MKENPVYFNSSQYSPENQAALENLAKKAQQGEDGAFGEIYSLFFEKIYRFIYFRVSHKETAEDLAEDVFVKAFQKIGSARDLSKLEAWIYQIARNLVIDHYRSQKSTVNLDDIADLPDLEKNLPELAQLSQEKSQILKALSLLPADDRKILTLKFVEGLDNAACAAILNKSEGALRVAQHRALKKLREISEDIF